MQKTTRTRLRRPTAQLLALLVVVAAAALTAMLTGSVSAPPAAATGRATTDNSSGDGLAAAGKRVYLRDCAYCHGEKGGGTQYAPSLEQIGPATTDFYLKTGRMPLASPDSAVQPGPQKYSDHTVKAIDAYVATFGEPGSGKPIPTMGPGDAQHGRSLFVYDCAPCHSSSGTGMIVPGGNFAPELYNTKLQQVAEAIRIGPGPMPEFTKEQLSDQEVQDIVAYVDQLGPQQDIGGNGLDEFGPIAEMLFALLVLIPFMLVVIRLLGKKAPK